MTDLNNFHTLKDKLNRYGVLSRQDAAEMTRLGRRGIRVYKQLEDTDGVKEIERWLTRLRNSIRDPKPKTPVNAVERRKAAAAQVMQ